MDADAAGSADVTRLLQSWRRGSDSAAERLMPLVYDELRAIARRQIRREGPGASICATDLVHEGYLRLLGQAASFENRAHFLALAATLMRRILVDRARRRHAVRRGGGQVAVTLENVAAWAAPVPLDVIALDRALTELASFDPNQSRIVELHFFGGLSFDEVATVLGISESTVFREWRVARLWLLKRLS